MKRLIALAAIGTLALALSGCGETRLDATKVEEQLESSLEKSLPSAFGGKSGEELAEEIGASPDEGIESVECPSGQEVEKGAEFSCTVTFDNGSQANETLRILNEDADVKALGLSPGAAE